MEGGTITRNANWKWAVTSEDEWFKAAYYKGGGTDSGYWKYPTQNDTRPGRDIADVSGNNANYYVDDFVIGEPYYRTEVGEFQNSESAYGTYDQAGNVWEWNESSSHNGVHAIRFMRGGSAFHYGDFGHPSSSRSYGYPTDEISYLGFRVVQAIPEPSSVFALTSGLGCLGVLLMRQRR